MALIVNVLSHGILTITGEDYFGFGGFPADILEASNRWSHIINNYGSKVTPSSSTFEVARVQMESIFLTMEVPSNNGIQVFKRGIKEYTQLLATGMFGFNSTPPPGQVNIEPAVAAGFAGASASAVASLLAQAIDFYFRTGTATNLSSGVTINWN